MCKKKASQQNLSESMEFFRLPVLVQNKIMRQYIPTLCKVSTLYEIPEFLDLFGFDESWLNPSETFFEFFKSVRSLKPGLYLCNEEQWFHAFYVSMDQEKISFKICCLNVDDPVSDISNGKTTNHFYKSLSEITDFFTTFLKKYVLYDEKIMSVYKLKPNEYFFVNHSTDEFRWIDGSKRTFKKSFCGSLLWAHFDHLSLGLIKNRFMHIRCKNFQSNYCMCEQKMIVLHPKSINQLLKREKQTLDVFEFRIVGDERVSVTCTDVEHFRSSEMLSRV